MAAAQTITVVSESPALPEFKGWRPARQAALLTFGFRLFYSFVAALFSPRLALNENLIRSNRLTDHLMSRRLHPILYSLLGVWERFDTLWYIEIARHGYDKPMATVFYPLYPILIRAVSVLTRSELAAAPLISTGATFFLFWGALRLFDLDGTSPASTRAILLWAVWPASFVFFAGYPDSLVCALIVWSLVLARSGRWLPASALGLLAGLTKAMGCLAAVPLLWIAWKDRRKEGLLAAASSLAGAACYQGWLLLRHFPSAAEVYRTWWMTTTVAPWITLRDAFHAAVQGRDTLVLLNLIVFALAGLAALLPSVRGECRLYAVAAMCLFLTKHTDPLLQSTTRYSLTLFAAYPALAAKLGRGVPFAIVLLLSAALNILLFRVFLDWGLVV